MARITVTRQWADGDVLCIDIKGDPLLDTLTDTVIAASETYNAALATTVTDEDSSES